MGALNIIDAGARKALGEVVTRLERQGEAKSSADVVSTLGRDVSTWTRDAVAPAVPPSLPLLTHDASGSKKIMITYLSAGNGHRTAAEALYGRLKEMFPAWEISKPVDVANLSKFGKASAALFYKTVDWGIWPWIYRKSDQSTGAGLLDLVRHKAETAGDQKFVDMVHQQAPDVIIHTNVFGAELQDAAAKSAQIPSNILNLQVVTDMDGHGLLAHSNADLTFAPNAEIANQLASKGLAPGKIAVTGIPINSVFGEKIDRAAVRTSLGLAPNGRVLLAQGNLIKDGSYFEKLMQNLAATYPDGAQGQPIQVVVACGKDAALLDQLRTLAGHYTGKVQLKPLGMLAPNQMRDVMGAADLTLTKPGGLTTAESMAMKLPMVLVDVMGGGQETKNAEFFTKQGASVTAHDFNGAIQQAVRLIANPGKLQEMRQAAERVANPDAARAIGQIVASLPVKAPAKTQASWLARFF